MSEQQDAKPPRTAEQREYTRVKRAESRARVKAKADKKFQQLSCKDELKPKDASEILLERGIKNAHVVEFCAQLAQTAARLNGIPFNHYLLMHGLRATLSKTTLPEIADEEVESEILYRRDLYALWDYGFWRHPEVTFEQWLADRRKFKSSAFEMSQLLGKEDFGATHKEWEKFLPRWNPVGLRPGYSQKQGLSWLDAQMSDTTGDKKRYLLVASRNSMKSTFVRIHALCFTICYPDGPMLFVSETNRLSRKAMREFRGYLEMQPNNPTLFQEYFGEYTVSQDDGSSLSYENPLAHLGLPQIACESSSMESANTGSRFTLCYFDDPISRDNGTANEEQKQAAISKFGSISKLREPSGFIVNVQTPWAQDDLGDVMIQRNEEDPEHPLAVRIDPVMEIRPEAKGKGLLELREEDVILNFLPKLNWRFVRDEMRSPEGTTFFRTQYLCQWVKDDEQIKVNFDHEVLWGRVRPQSFFGSPLMNTTFIALDRSWSTSRYADFSCANVCRIQSVENKNAMVVLDTYMDRVRESELILGLVKLIEKWRPTLLIGQQDKGYLDFGDSLRKALMMRGIPVPYLRFVPVNNAPKAKVRRVKALELPLHDGRLFFSSGNVKLEEGLNQMEKFDGVTPSNSHRKDDWPDSVALAWEHMGPRHQEEIPTEDLEKRRLEEEEEGARQRRQHFYNAMFSGDPPRRAPTTVEEQPQAPRDERLRVFGFRGPWRM